MGHSVVYRDQLVPIGQDSFQNIATVLICENLLLRAGLRHILSGTRFVVADEDAEDWAAFTDRLPVLFLICDNRTPDEYAETADELKAKCPSARVVVLTDALDPEAVMHICQTGVDGICSTSMAHHVLIKALEIVMLGETFIPASVGLALIDQLRQGRGFKPGTSFMAANDPAALLCKLSEREAQILRCLTQGSSNKVIARELGVAEATVKVHIKAILRKVKASNRTQAAMWAAGYLNSAQDDEGVVPGA